MNIHKALLMMLLGGTTGLQVLLAADGARRSTPTADTPRGRGPNTLRDHVGAMDSGHAPGAARPVLRIGGSSYRRPSPVTRLEVDPVALEPPCGGEPRCIEVVLLVEGVQDRMRIRPAVALVHPNMKS